MLNSGVSFGLFPGLTPWILILLLLGLVIYAAKMRELWGRVGIVMIIVGGGMNLVSRIRYGGVVDNLDFFGLFYNNIWDYLIVAGLVVYVWNHFTKLKHN